ncbi:MAG: alpha/beta fold hydrolase [Thermoanaerobaculia bacterium]
MSSAALAGNPWFACLQPNPLARLRLFCFPYAGGRASIFRGWHLHLAPLVEVVPVELPGRGARFREGLHSEIGALAEGVLEALGPALDLPFAFFGHSMGAHVSFELARRLARRGGPLPERLLLAAACPPHLSFEGIPSHELSEEAFVDRLRHYAGTPQAVLDNSEIMAAMLPVIRADLQVSETYHLDRSEAVEVPIGILCGKEDAIARPREMERWAELTARGSNFYLLPGGHFFLHTAEKQVLRLLLKELHEAAAALLGAPAAV